MPSRRLPAALGNHPLLIAEAIARPILAENRLRVRYYGDESIHGDRKAQALEELSGLAGPRDLRTLSSTYHEEEYRLLPDGEGTAGYPEERRRGFVRCGPALWREQLQALGSAFRRSFRPPLGAFDTHVKIRLSPSRILAPLSSASLTILQFCPPMLQSN